MMITEEVKNLLRAICEGKQMQRRWIDAAVAGEWFSCKWDDALRLIASGNYNHVRIKPEPQRMYGRYYSCACPALFDFHLGHYNGATHYFDIDPDTNEPIGEIKRLK